MATKHDFSNWPQTLYEFSIYQFTKDKWLSFDKKSKILSEAQNANVLRAQAVKNDQYAFYSWWLKFEIAVECLVKAVFLKHKISLLRKNDISKKAPNKQNELATQAAANVYCAVTNSDLIAKNNAWLQSMFNSLSINHPLEINSGTLGIYRKNIDKLAKKHLISQSEQQQIEDSLQVLLDIRRNVDAHMYLKLQVGGSINKDLTAVYLPMCNLLIKVFNK